MASTRSLFATLFLMGATTVMAQNSSRDEMTFPFFGYDDQPIDASVVAADSQATTLALNCRPGTDQNDCGLFPSQTLVVGVSTYHMDESGDGFTGTQECDTAAVTQVVCTESNGGSEANFPGSSVSTYASSDIAYIMVTITAGIDRLTGSGAPASTTATSVSGGDNGGSSTATTTATGSSGTTASAGSGGDSSSIGTDSAAATSSTGLANIMDSRESFGLVGVAAGLLGYLVV